MDGERAEREARRLRKQLERRKELGEKEKQEKEERLKRMSDAVRTLLQAELDRLSHALPHRLRRFAVINRRLEPGDPELTPMLRLRRDVVARAHPDLLQALFAPG